MQIDTSTEAGVRALLEQVLHYSTADQTEVVYQATHSALTRFATNHIHQNVTESDHELSVRAVIGKKTGVATTNQLDDASLRRVVEQACTIANIQPENPEFHGLPGPQPIIPAPAYSAHTAQYTAEERARQVSLIVRLAQEHGLEAAGAFSTNSSVLAVANSLGIFAYQPDSDAEVHAVLMADADGSSYLQRVATDVTTFDLETLARDAVQKALRSRNPIAIPLGSYPVVLDTYATSEMLYNLAYMGFSATAVQEERSFMNGQFGRQIADPRVTIYDDAHDPAGLPQAFDYEGVPKQRVTFIDKGIANAVVYDSFTAARANRPNTGHALPAPNPEGPTPLHLMMQPGDASLSELIKGIDKGIYVTRFHYTNPVHPVKTIFTGMTRDGTFLIENGEITQPVKNMRFTQNILDALRDVQAIGRERIQYTDYLTVVAPALRIANFHFTGTTGS